MAYSYMHVYLLRAGNFRSQSLAGDEAAGGTGASKWKTALNPMRVMQGMRRPSIAQPSPPPTEAAVAKPEPDVTPGSRSEVGGGAGDSGDSPLIGEGGSSPLDSRYSVYLLYQYKSTNIDTPLLA